MLADSLQRVIAFQDSLLRLAAVRSVHFRDGNWWSSALLTVLGGLLAVGGGMFLEVFKAQRAAQRLRNHLAEEIEVIVTALDDLRGCLRSASDETRRAYDNVNIARLGGGDVSEDVARALAPNMVYLVRRWYADLKWTQEGVMGTIANLRNVQAGDVQAQLDGLRRRTEEVERIMDRGRLIVVGLRAYGNKILRT